MSNDAALSPSLCMSAIMTQSPAEVWVKLTHWTADKPAVDHHDP